MPRYRELAFGKCTHQCSQVIRLLEVPLTDLGDVTEVFLHLVEKFASNETFSSKQAVERILTFCVLTGESVEFLKALVSQTCRLTQHEILTVGSTPSHSRQRSYNVLIQAGCCDDSAFEGPLTVAPSSSSVSIRILRSFPSSSLPWKMRD